MVIISTAYVLNLIEWVNFFLIFFPVCYSHAFLPICRTALHTYQKARHCVLFPSRTARASVPCSWPGGCKVLALSTSSPASPRVGSTQQTGALTGTAPGMLLHHRITLTEQKKKITNMSNGSFSELSLLESFSVNHVTAKIHINVHDPCGCWKQGWCLWSLSLWKPWWCLWSVQLLTAMCREASFAIV